MQIQRKIWVLVGIAMLTSAVVSSIGLYGVRKINNDVAEIAGNSVPALIAVSEMRSNYLATIPLLHERAGTADASTGGELEKRINEEHGKLLAQLDSYSRQATSEAEQESLTQVKFRLLNFITRAKGLNGLAASGATDIATQMIRRDVMPLHHELAKAFDGLVKLNTARVGRVAESAESAFARTGKDLVLVMPGRGLISKQRHKDGLQVVPFGRYEKIEQVPPDHVLFSPTGHPEQVSVAERDPRLTVERQGQQFHILQQVAEAALAFA